MNDVSVSIDENQKAEDEKIMRINQSLKIKERNRTIGIP